MLINDFASVRYDWIRKAEFWVNCLKTAWNCNFDDERLGLRQTNLVHVCFTSAGTGSHRFCCWGFWLASVSLCVSFHSERSGVYAVVFENGAGGNNTSYEFTRGSKAELCCVSHLFWFCFHTVVQEQQTQTKQHVKLAVLGNMFFLCTFILEQQWTILLMNDWFWSSINHLNHFFLFWKSKPCDSSLHQSRLMTSHTAAGLWKTLVHIFADMSQSKALAVRVWLVCRLMMLICKLNSTLRLCLWPKQIITLTTTAEITTTVLTLQKWNKLKNIYKTQTEVKQIRVSVSMKDEGLQFSVLVKSKSKFCEQKNKNKWFWILTQNKSAKF